LREALQLGSGDALYFAKALQLIEHDALQQRRSHKTPNSVSLDCPSHCFRHTL